MEAQASRRCRQPGGSSRTLVYLHAPAAEPMAQRAHHQCNRAAARRVQAKDQDANRTAVSSRSHAVLGAACLWTDQHAQGRWMANARRKAQQSADGPRSLKRYLHVPGGCATSNSNHFADGTATSMERTLF